MKQVIIKRLMFFCLVLCFVSLLPVYGQTGGKEECLKVMKEMVARYQASKYLAFTVTYRYADERVPNVYLDSLKGSYRINGSDYWYSLDSTEVASYHGTCVLLFKEDHIMYLVPPNMHKRNVDFLAALDSLLSHQGEMTPVLSDGPQTQRILLSFGGKAPLKSIEYTIDKASGYITRIRQLVKSDRLYDPSVRSRIEGEIPYAIVDMDFSAYRSGAFDEKQLDTTQYFKKEGQQYVTVAPYDEYKFFLGAPNL